MPFNQADSVRYFSFDIFADVPITQAVFTRQGGVSRGAWDSLNVGATVGDELENVFENRERSFKAVGRDINTMYDSWLMHGTDVLIAEAANPRKNESPPKGDILLTDKPGVTLFMRYADCVPILFYDPQHKVIGLAHAGWRGTVDGVVTATLEAMQGHYGTKAENVLAGIGPAISPERYEVGPEVVAEVEECFGTDAAELLPRYNGSTHFDLWKTNQYLLEQAGVKQVEVAGLCTASNPEDWFSHRGDKGKTGRFGALVALA
ncbi:MAG: peptidoglycan editing factor PgeF [Chloroflexi bacterium]|nr:MAG: peptidoglycan editing factor PgeF [Chloroflexota bacterium]MBL1195530.1 peptidoglycan editing factor PgeF [Chloroflexota bacterium]NOH12812.1 peptidoglycan editing factor PgeF [Chloroflexota bacterium]